MSDFIGLVSARRGEVVSADAQTLLVEFSQSRCENCTCSFSAARSEISKIAFSRSLLEAGDSKTRHQSPDAQQELTAGQKVLVSVPANRLRLITSSLFGLPVAVGLLGGFVANHFIASEIAQAGVVLGGFALGALVSLRLSKLLQRQFYDRLSITPLDC